MELWGLPWMGTLKEKQISGFLLLLQTYHLKINNQAYKNFLSLGYMYYWAQLFEGLLALTQELILMQVSLFLYSKAF